MFLSLGRALPKEWLKRFPLAVFLSPLPQYTEGTVGEVTAESERETVEAEEERELAKVWDLEKEKREERVSDWEEVVGGEGAMRTIDAMVLSLSF